MLINVVLLALASSIGGIGTIVQKKYAARTVEVPIAKPIYILGLSLLSLIPYGIMSGWRLKPDFALLFYSIDYALVLIATIILQFIAYNRMNLILINIFGKGSVVLTWLSGICIFGEKFTANGLAAQLLIVVAVILPFIAEKSDDKKINLSTCLIGIGIMLIGTMSNIVLKSYCLVPGVDSGELSSFYFYVNVFSVAVPIFMIIKARNGRESISAQIKSIPAVNYLFIVANCVVGAPSTLLSTFVFKKMALVDYTIASTFIYTAVLFITSRVIFREKGEKSEIISLLLVIAAVIINVF